MTDMGSLLALDKIESAPVFRLAGTSITAGG